MMKYIFFLILVGTSFIAANAQKHYHYFTDQQFNKPEDFMGYQLKPNEYSTKDGSGGKLAVGEVYFLLTDRYFVFHQGGVDRMYNTNTITEREYGFQAILMDIKNPTFQGHAKYILSPKGRLDAIIFKAENKAQEVIYLFPELTDKEIIEETKYFSVKDLISIPAPQQDGLWHTTIAPFYELSNLKRRLFVDDNVNFQFKRDTLSAIQGKKAMEYVFADKLIVNYNFLTGDKASKGLINYTITKVKTKSIGNSVLVTYDIVNEANDQAEQLFVFVNENKNIEYFDYASRRYVLRSTPNMPDRQPFIATPVSASKMAEHDTSDIPVEEPVYEFKADEEEEDRFDGFPGWYTIEK